MLPCQSYVSTTHLLSNEIRIEDKELFNRYIHGFPYQVSDINFTNLFMWRHLYELRYEVINGLLCISGYYYGEPFILPPLTLKPYNPEILSHTLTILKNRFKIFAHPLKIKFLPVHMLNEFQDLKHHKISFNSDRDNFDYIYATKDLSTLQGRKYHSKKNHLNFFMRNTVYEYVPLTASLVDQCMDLTRKLKLGEYPPLEKDLLENEEQAIYEALIHMKQLDYIGAAILINDRVEAFTLGEKTTNDTMLIHIEKANAEIRGLYQAINYLFCQEECGGVKCINREEDMGFENLRKAKESYHPAKFLEKYDVIVE
ncbi:DUF2156 domain-containing protein [Geosporobacter ferrireducens]|uniref:DUF2156 domain-containing protein n=1 Tax=Geosporobacter ferrireducens TaxID=1424294 RepID=UPI00139C998F|nr:phosphatidylglycerol lysyltransferase domain-containing protein [Geosporobacter ferrireducens]MTI53241.1 DUF2156 domain-containing protein [Geosporobacter ferrireducens]